jgi:hypothetical protein
VRVPFGVIIIGLLAVFAGVLYLLNGLTFLGAIVFGPIPSGDGRILAGVLAIIVGIIWIAVGGAAFSLKPWAWVFGVIMAFFGLFESLLALLTTLSWEYAIATAVLPVFILWYLNREKIKQAFGVADELV